MNDKAGQRKERKDKEEDNKKNGLCKMKLR
jgi:hypothetical protein